MATANTYGQGIGYNNFEPIQPIYSTSNLLYDINKANGSNEEGGFMSALGDVGIGALTGGAYGGPAGAVAGGTVGVLKSALSWYGQEKARRAQKRAADRAIKREEKRYKQQLAMQQQQIAMQKQGFDFNKDQYYTQMRVGAAENNYSKLMSMVNRNTNLRQFMVQKGYI